MIKYIILFLLVFTQGEALLYVYRPLLNGDDLQKWAKEQGLQALPNNLHVTLAYSPNGVKSWSVVKDADPDCVYNLDNHRQFDLFGNGNILVLKLNAPELSERWKELIKAGATWDFPTYEPHITLSYSADRYNLKKIVPYKGELIFGPEVYEFR